MSKGYGKYYNMLLHVGDNSFQMERGSSNVCKENVRFQTTENKLCQESNTEKMFNRRD